MLFVCTIRFINDIIIFTGQRIDRQLEIKFYIDISLQRFLLQETLEHAFGMCLKSQAFSDLPLHV